VTKNIYQSQNLTSEYVFYCSFEKMLDKFFIYIYIFLDIDALPVISWFIEQHISIVALTR